jgi:hypothetical protein
MSVVEPGPASSGLIQRVQDILLRPKPTWDVIDVEPADEKSLFTGYAMILAAIPALAGFIGGVVFGHGAFGVTFRTPIVTGLISAVVTYALTLLAVFLLGLIIDALAPSFDGQKSRIQALKVAVYSMTASWVGGIFAIFPPLAILGVLFGLYGLYLLYLGIPKLMKAPQEKALGYTIVTIIVAIVLNIVIAAVVAGVAGMGALGAASIASQGASVEMGDANVNVMAAAKKVEQAAKQLEAGATGEGVDPVDVEVLKAHLPNAVAGFSRTEVSTGSAGVGSISGASAEGKYQKGDARITLTVVDMGAAGGVLGIAGAFNVNSSSESEGRYEKVHRVGGRMTMEEFDRNSGHGEYGVMVADRFMVQAEGESGATINDLKAAVTSVNFARLEGLARG